LSIIYRKFLKKLGAKITLNPSSLDGWTRNSLKKQERDKGVKGYAPFGVPPPLGGRGGHPYRFSKRMKKDRISTKPRF